MMGWLRKRKEKQQREKDKIKEERRQFWTESYKGTTVLLSNGRTGTVTQVESLRMGYPRTFSLDIDGDIYANVSVDDIVGVRKKATDVKK